MKRRNFIFTTIFSLFTYKAFAHSLMRLKKIPSGNMLITSDNNTCIVLKSGMTYELPSAPNEILSVIHFRVQKTKWGRSPILNPSSKRIAKKSGLFEVEKEVSLDYSRNFTLQYINEDMGWIVLS